MNHEGFCTMSEHRCWRLGFNREPCEDDLKIEEAGACIRHLEDEVTNLMEELAATDRLFGRLKAEAIGIVASGAPQ